MRPRQEKLELVRLTLASAASTLLNMTNPTGPYAEDLTIAGELVAIIKRLGPEEQASLQLAKVDQTLKWWGSSKSRIERLEELLKLEGK